MDRSVIRGRLHELDAIRIALILKQPLELAGQTLGVAVGIGTVDSDFLERAAFERSGIGRTVDGLD